MATKRKPTAPTTEVIDQLCAAFDDLFARSEERTALRQYLIGLLLPREHNKTLVELGAIVPGANRQALHHGKRCTTASRTRPGTARRSTADGSCAGKPIPISDRMQAACRRRAHRG